ncbi:MAG: SH3 domain-containing protein [Parvularculaceae bacterium]
MNPRVAVFILVIGYLSLAGMPAQAEDVMRRDTPSGLPVPRFVSLKDEETNCRIGPSFEHPVRFVFKRSGAPVLIVAESVDHWRKLRDSEGDECWAHQTTLKAQTHVLTIAPVELTRKPGENAAVSAHLGAGVLARLVKRRNGRLLLSAGAAKGWVDADAVWGGEAPGASDRRN